MTIRDLRNRGGDVIERVAAGEELTVTRDGKPVARLSPLTGPALPAAVLVERRRHLAPVDPRALQRDIDRILDTRL